MGGGWFPTRAIRRFYAASDKPVSIFKLMYNQASNRPTLNYLTRDKDIHVLHLRRHNLLKMHVSQLLMPTKRNAIWEPHTTEPLPPVTTHVDPAAALEQMRRAGPGTRNSRKCSRAIAACRWCTRSSSRASGFDPRRARRICDFFGVRDHPMQSSLIKLNPEIARGHGDQL